MAVNIAVETVESMTRDDIAALLAQHNAAVASFPDRQVLAPDTAMYAQCERAGTFFVIVAREHGEPVGYAGTFISRHRFYAGMVFANNDMLFVAPKYRGTTLAFRLMRATVIEARRRGATLMGWAAKPGSRLEHMLRRLGHTVEESLYLVEI